jgi:uncharacterized protein (DUF1501 family)
MNRERRDFLAQGCATVAALGLPSWVRAQQPAARRLLVLVELRGGNDALNTVVPVDDGRYHDLRPRLALRDEAVVRLADGPAVHAALSALRPVWDAKEMALLEGVGYPQPNLSHFRSIEIWDTASDSDRVLAQGWLTRAAASPVFARHAADGVVIGGSDLGPLGGGSRTVSLNDPQRFGQQAQLAREGGPAARGALAHVLLVENDIAHAAAHLRPAAAPRTEFPRGAFGAALRHAAAIASTREVPVIRVTLAGFDTHRAQAPVHARLLQQLAEGVFALRGALQEMARWDDTLVLTYSEFGRRPRENASGGTDHGTAGVLFAFGPHVKAGRHGTMPGLDRLDASGNLPHALDFRQVYAGVLGDWFSVDPVPVLGRRFAPVAFLKT